jgi:hypothetical protein
MRQPLSFPDDGRPGNAGTPDVLPARGPSSFEGPAAVRRFVRRRTVSGVASTPPSVPALDRRCPGLGIGYPRAVQEALVEAYDDEMRASFGDPGHPREILHVLNADTGRVVERRAGTAGRVGGDAEDLERWSQAGPFLVAHTHPNSVPHSFTDLYTVYAANANAGWLANTAMIVFGGDGSWYELRLPLGIDGDRIDAIERDVEAERAWVTAAAARAVDDEIARQIGLGRVDDASGSGGSTVWIRQSDGCVRAHSRVALAAQARAHGIDADAMMARFCQGPLTRMWQRLARTHGFVFRSHRLPASGEVAA